MQAQFSEFLVHMELEIPPDMPKAKLDALYEAEAAAAKPLIDAGVFERVWREPGTRNHWAIWHAPDVDFVHRAYSAFPLFAWMTVTIRPLAINTNDPGPPQLPPSYRSLRSQVEALLPERVMP